LIDLAVVDRRYFSASNYQRKNRNSGIALSAGDQQVLADTSYFRVMNINGTMSDALTSYYHNSVGGYHGAKIRRYQDLYDSCVVKELQSLIANAQEGTFDFSSYSTLNMLNTKYLMYGQNRENVIPNREANGNAWFVREVKEVNSANEELSTTCSINSKYQAVVDGSQFKLNPVSYDSSSTIRLTNHAPNRLKYQATTSVNSLAVFSEIYYPKGWKATLDGVEVSILRANYVLRALEVPAGNHTIEFTFEPDAYRIGNKITMASSWLLIVVLLGSLGWSWKKDD
jgi:hypothetical protein